MPRVARRPDAKADLIHIWDYIAQDNREAADTFLRRLYKQFELIATQPFMGRERPELGENIRSYPVSRYVIYYQPLEDGIEVVRVLHASRDVARFFRQ